MTKFCQYVTQKNRNERLVYAQTCLKFNENFDQKTFVDESIIQMVVGRGSRFCLMKTLSDWFGNLNRPLR